jgi:hypothetical protein
VATVCPSFLRGNVMRVTRLDGCGRPIYGDCNQVVSDGFVTATLSAEVEEGEEVTVTKANGRTCISDKACDQLRWYTTEIEFCQVDPDLIQIMNPTWEKILDWQGDTIGYDAKGNLSCDTGFGLEIWMDTYGATDACSGETSQGAYGYLLLPWVVGGAPGDLEIGNDAISFTFNGRTKLGSRWGRGPYPVMLGSNGAPGPLLTPVSSQTQYRLFVTTIRPPEPECGCQPVDRPTPEPATLTLTGVAGESPRRTVRMRADNHGFGPVMIDWGDGTPAQEASDGAFVTHTYATDGDYTITVSDQQTPAITVTKDITVPLPADDPTLTLSADDPVNRMRVTAAITLPIQSSGEGTIEWGDGSDIQSFTTAADGTASLVHTYTANGVYTVTVRRADVDSFRARQAVAVPVGADPTVTVTGANTDATGQTASLTYNNAPNGPVTINWGDGTTVDGVESATVTHPYTTAGAHTITVTSKSNPAASTTVTVTTPLMVLTATETTGNASSTDLLAENFTAGPVTVNWGDSTATSANPGDGTTVSAHVYAAPGSYTITATDDSDATRKGTVTVTIPWP